MRKFYVALSLALITVLTRPELTRPGMALTSAEAVDQANAYPNVGSIMVWRDANNPLGLPGGLAGHVTAVLIHPQTILTAGHFAARAESFGTLPPWLRIVVSFAPNALDQSTWIDISAPAARASLILLFRGPAPHRVARSTTPTGSTSRGSATSAYVFSTSPCSASDRPSWPTAASTMSVSRARE